MQTGWFSIRVAQQACGIGNIWKHFWLCAAEERYWHLASVAQGPEINGKQMATATA